MACLRPVLPLLIAATGLAMCPGRAVAQNAFSLSEPASSSQSITVQDTATQSSQQTTIVPRLTGPASAPAHPALRDENTGADIQDFGSAYFYANPLYGTDHLHDNEIGGQQGGGGGAASAVFSVVVARFGYPPQTLPVPAGTDLRTYQPQVKLIRYALQTSGDDFPNEAEAGILDLALHTMGRAAVTQIDIEASPRIHGEPEQEAMLRQVALALVHLGANPSSIFVRGDRILPRAEIHTVAYQGAAMPGHVLSLVLTGAS